MAVKTPSKKPGLTGPPEISFQRGINTFQQNRLLLQTGECATMLNADFSKIGYIGILQSNTSYKTGFTGRVHTLFKTGKHLFVGHGTTMSHVDVETGTVTPIGITFNGADLHVISYENFCYVTDGYTPKKIYIPTLAVSAWGFDAPLAAPTATAGDTGLPNGTYNLYYTYVAKYPDGTEYETDLSPVGQVAVSLKMVNWVLPGTAPDSQITHYRLYRDKTGISATLDQLRAATEAEQARLEAASGVLKFSNILQSVIRRQTNKQIVNTMGSDANIIVGPFFVAEVEVAATAYNADNYGDDTLVLNIPHLKERYRPIFGSTA